MKRSCLMRWLRLHLGEFMECSSGSIFILQRERECTDERVNLQWATSVLWQMVTVSRTTDIWMMRLTQDVYSGDGGLSFDVSCHIFGWTHEYVSRLFRLWQLFVQSTFRQSRSSIMMITDLFEVRCTAGNGCLPADSGNSLYLNMWLLCGCTLRTLFSVSHTWSWLTNHTFHTSWHKCASPSCVTSRIVMTRHDTSSSHLNCLSPENRNDELSATLSPKSWMTSVWLCSSIE